jgi:hypothetical protein
MSLRSLSARILLTATALTLIGSLHRDAQPHARYQEVFERDPQGNYILVFAYPSSAYLDWSGPSNLARTMGASLLARNLLGRPSSLGHAQFAWYCQGEKAPITGAAGQSGEHHGQGLKALLGGWGLSLLQLTYTDGNLETAEEVNQRIQNGMTSGQFSWLGLKVSAATCRKVADYVNAYQAAQAYQNYGFPVDPLKLEGGGCTSFASAAVTRSGLNLPFQAHWTREYRLPEAQMGRAASPPPFSAIMGTAQVPATPKHVDAVPFFFQQIAWAKLEEPGVPFVYYDPELFHESFMHLENAYRQTQGLPLRPALRTPDMDAFQSRLKASTEVWFDQLQAQGNPMALGHIHGVPGLIVSMTGPSTVGHFTRPPRKASSSVIGRSMRILSPSRRTKG